MSQVIVKRKEELAEDEIMHSDTYLGVDYSTGLCHWKYVKKYKVGNRWRYVYKSELTKKIMDTPDSPKKLEKEDKLVEWVPVGTYKTSKGQTRYTYLSANGKRYLDSNKKIKTTKISKLKKSLIVLKGKRWIDGL